MEERRASSFHAAGRTGIGRLPAGAGIGSCRSCKSARALRSQRLRHVSEDCQQPILDSPARVRSTESRCLPSAHRRGTVSHAVSGRCIGEGLGRCRSRPSGHAARQLYDLQGPEVLEFGFPAHVGVRILSRSDPVAIKRCGVRGKPAPCACASRFRSPMTKPRPEGSGDLRRNLGRGGDNRAVGYSP